MHRHDGAERACLGWCLVTTDWTAGKLSRGQRDFVRAQLGELSQATEVGTLIVF